MSDLECPYCGAGQNVDHDDGHGFEEDRAHEMECSECEKNFVFHTIISFSYSPSKADCLNGAPHDLRDIKANFGSNPDQVILTRCQNCDFEARGPQIEKAHAEAKRLAEPQ